MRSVLMWCAVLLLALPVVPCVADELHGVAVEERVVQLPNDAGKWYISVVGDPDHAMYQELLSWFETDPSLVKVKAQVHLCRVEKGTPIYAERYAAIKGKWRLTALPCVRLQKPDGEVVYQACGAQIPMSAGGLNGALADAVNGAQDRILPWRRGVDDRLNQPQPSPEPDVDPMPDPLDDGGIPNIDPAPVSIEGVSPVLLAVVVVVVFLGALFGSFVVKLQRAMK